MAPTAWWPKDRSAFGRESFCSPPCSSRRVRFDIFAVPASVVFAVFASGKTFAATSGLMRLRSVEQTPQPAIGVGNCVARSACHSCSLAAASRHESRIRRLVALGGEDGMELGFERRPVPRRTSLLPDEARRSRGEPQCSPSFSMRSRVEPTIDLRIGNGTTERSAAPRALRT